MHAPQLGVPDARESARHAPRPRRPRADTELGHRYELLEIVAKSNTSTVFCALDLAHDRLVAIKSIAASQQQCTDARAQRVRREAQTLERLRHPNLVRCLGAGVVDREAARRWPADLREGAPYIVLEYATAGSLQRLAGALEWSDVRIIMGQLLGALGHVHRVGLLHRDVKPSNILLADLSPYRIELADLDLVTPWGSGAASLRADAAAISGTPAYMAPEQFHGRRASWGPWTDLYACGCVAWTLLTGAPPYGVDPARAREGHLAGTLPRFTRCVPSGALRWVTRLLARVPADRFPSAALARAALVDVDDTANDSITDPEGARR